MYSEIIRNSVYRLLSTTKNYSMISKACGVPISTIIKWEHEKNFCKLIKQKIKKKKFECAYDLINNGLVVYGDNKYLYSQLIYVLNKLDRNDEAINRTKAILEKYPKDKVLLRQLINLLMSERKYVEAQLIAQRAFDLYPENRGFKNKVLYFLNDNSPIYNQKEYINVSEHREKLYDPTKLKEELNNLEIDIIYNSNSIKMNMLLIEGYHIAGLTDKALKLAYEVITNPQIKPEEVKIIKNLVEIIKNKKLIPSVGKQKIKSLYDQIKLIKKPN